MSVSPSQEQLRGMYRTMAWIRACDEVVREGLSRGRLVYFYFPVTGHEAIASALSEAINQDDYMVVTYRGMHNQLAKGVAFERILGEMTGKVTGISKGKSGAMHICQPEVGLMITTGIVGGGLPGAVGLALSSKIKKDGRVTVVCFGDGAINTGSFHEAANMAAVWNLPLIFVCENNRFAETTPSHLTYKGKITARAEGYGIPAETVDGYDPVKLFGAMTHAVERARGGGGPTLIDATCFRYFGHYFGDPMITVPKDELQAEMERDPFKNYGLNLVQAGVLSEAEAGDIKAKADKKATDILNATVAAANPPPEVVLSGAYANAIEVR